MTKPKPMPLFLALQVADFASTLTALALGGSEQNPLVSHLMGFGPISGLLLSKLLVVLLAAMAVQAQRSRSVRVANVAFAGVVVWNCFIVARLIR